MFNLVKIGAAANEAVTVAELKTHCRISHTADDTYLGTLRIAAREQVEKDLGMVIASQAYRLHTEANFTSVVCLPVQPVQSISSVTYTDVNHVSQTLSTSNYSLKAHRDPPEVEFDGSLPVGTDVVINFLAGFAPDTVPALTKQAVLFLAASWYESREPEVVGTIVTKLPLGYERIISRLRISRYR